MKKPILSGGTLSLVLMIPALFVVFYSGESRTPLIDMGEETYLGFEGGLYPGGSNAIPADHAGVGWLRAADIQPRNVNGIPDPDGTYVMLSIGMSNTASEFCGYQADGVTCNSWSFMGQAAAHPLVNHTDLTLINGALSGAAATAWMSPTAFHYDRIRDVILAPLGLSEQQVQVVWVKLANAWPGISLPDEDADAHALLYRLGAVTRALKIRYPNLQQVFLSSRIYAGYATVPLNPEPYAYESAFSVKWLIEAQINQMSGGGIHPQAGDLNYNTVAPWLAWGPYLWADGVNPRSDDLTWQPEDFNSDGTHPSEAGQEKAGTLLLDFFLTSPMTVVWFMDGEGPDLQRIYLPLVVDALAGR